MVAKKWDSTYQPGRRSSAWIKDKNWNTQEIVIGGWREGDGGRSSGIGALLMGIPGEGGGVDVRRPVASPELARPAARQGTGRGEIGVMQQMITARDQLLNSIQELAGTALRQLRQPR